MGARCASAGSTILDGTKCCCSAPASAEAFMRASVNAVICKAPALSMPYGQSAVSLLLRHNACGPLSSSRRARCTHAFDAVSHTHLLATLQAAFCTCCARNSHALSTRNVGPTSTPLCGALTAADEGVEGGNVSLYRMVPYGSYAWPRVDFRRSWCVWVSDLCNLELVLVARRVFKVGTVANTARALARERLRARKTIRLGTEAKAPADKEI